MLSVLVMGAVLAPGIEVTTAADGTPFARQGVATPSSAAKAVTRTIYLNRHGGIVRPGTNDSQADTSTIVTQQVALAGWSVGDAKWQATVDCVRGIWAPFDVTITDVDPGAVAHVEVMVGDVPETMGLPSGIGGISPLSYTCSVIESSIVFVYPANLSNSAQHTCEAISHEVGHSYGLDHELLAADPMTYLSYTGQRTFQDETAACGESTERPCGVDGHTCRPDQNSYALLMERIGAFGSDNTAPEVAIVAPADGATVPAGFVVNVAATDNVGVTAVTLFVDGEPVTSVFQPPFDLASDPALAAGEHAIAIEAIDGNDNTTTRAMTLRIGKAPVPLEDDPPPPSGGCSTTGDAPGFAIVAFGLLALRRRRSPAITPSRA